MSGWGTTEIGGEPVHAWDYRTRYLAHGEKHDTFYCPFCDIRLAACLIYSDGELSKSPHFSAKWEEHRFDCDGEPLEVDEPDRRPPKAHYQPRTMNVPEALTERPAPRVTRPSGLGGSFAPPTGIEVVARRKAAGSLGKPVPKTYLLQPIVEAFSITCREIFALADEKKWDDTTRKATLKAALSALPLRLEDKTTYEDAFRSPAFLNWTNPRIYHALGTVAFGDAGLVISSKAAGKIKGIPRPLKVVIPSSVDGSTPKSQVALIDQLHALAAEKTEFRWYAYGRPQACPDAIFISLLSLDHLYLKSVFRRQQ